MTLGPCAGKFKIDADRKGMALKDMAAALAANVQSSQALRAMLQDTGRPAFQEFLDGVDKEHQHGHPEASHLDFGLFSPFPSVKRLLIQTEPVIWLTQLALWPELVSEFLQLIRCSPMPQDRDDGALDYVQRLLPYPNIECWKQDHNALMVVAALGLTFWCLGIPALLFLRIWMLSDRQDPENYRRFGFFIQGLAPQFWYWDLIVKRADIALMLLVAYTSIANDDNAKLLLFPLISGMQLGISTWTKPYANCQSQILDVLEFVLLTSRFALFSTVAILLIFFPSAEIIWLWALLLFAGILCAEIHLPVIAFAFESLGIDLLSICSNGLPRIVLTLAYSSVHILAQFLRGQAADMEDGENQESEDRNALQKQPML